MTAWFADLYDCGVVRAESPLDCAAAHSLQTCMVCRDGAAGMDTMIAADEAHFVRDA